ncbi:MAG: SMP-30/gluconolactonase/LRE family protein [Bacteroidales bacterium]|nr:SMP-30/gluconolactonase/LRE family protein [Bacteroidales bacterium]
MKNLILSLLLCFVILPMNGQNTMKLICGTGEAGFKDGKKSELNKPIRLTPYEKNSIIFADINNHAIRIVSLDGKVTTIAGGPDKEGYQDGPAETAKFKSPHGVAYDPKSGKIYVASASNHVIRMLTPVGKGKYDVSTVAGVPEKSGFQDGEAKTALFNSPHAVVISPDGGLVIVDIGNARVRKIKNGKVTTLAGTGEAGQMDGPPEVATFTYPMDIVMDMENVLAADAATNLVRKIVPGVEISTVPLQGSLKTPHGIAIDAKKNIYIADMGTNRIMKIDSQGKVEPIAGTGKPGTDLANLNKPAAVLVHAGYIWVADLNNHQIKVIPLP